MSDPLFRRIPLRIPGGWFAEYNEWYEVDPSKLERGDPNWNYLTETLAHFRLLRFGIEVDVGWYPEAKSDGGYTLQVLYERDWSSVIASHRTVVLADIVAHLESTLVAPPMVPVGRILEQLTGIDPDARARAAELLDRQNNLEAIEFLKAASVRESHVPTLETMNRVLENLLRSRIQQQKRSLEGRDRE